MVVRELMPGILHGHAGNWQVTRVVLVDHAVGVKPEAARVQRDRVRQPAKQHDASEAQDGATRQPRAREAPALCTLVASQVQARSRSRAIIGPLAQAQCQPGACQQQGKTRRPRDAAHAQKVCHGRRQELVLDYVPVRIESGADERKDSRAGKKGAARDGTASARTTRARLLPRLSLMRH